jgi:hypothetical protein
MTLSSVAVFCGSRFGTDPAYADLARHAGRTFAERGITVVYGGGDVGLMGALADATMEAGGRVIGVIPRQLHEREVSHAGVTELRVVESMHERKAMMAELADAFIALPGGVGTLEEITEQWTWAQLRIHSKPCAFLDVPGQGFWAPMAAMVDQMIAHGFVAPGEPSIPVFADDLATLLDEMNRTAPTSETFDPDDMV